ncbi:hypothetical protein HYW99_01940 [Candidatus Woesearchaeota archaeon]|nr:hypothetical protein [Candidatus Woesearchaeota archaeon]
MLNSKIDTFELVILLIGLAAAILGFQLINSVYKVENQISWLMVIAIFNWLTLLVLFILLSSMVYVAKRELHEIRTMIYLLSEEKKRR